MRWSAFRLLWCASLAWSGAQLMERVATLWLALETGGGPLAVGIVLAARTLPSFVLGLTAGALADRFDRRRVLMSVAGGAVLLMTVLGLLVRSGLVELWQVALIALLSGCLQVTDSPSRQALVVDLAGRENAGRGIALNALASRLFGAVGAIAGGVAIPVLGVASCYFLVAAAYLVDLVLVALIARRAAAQVSLSPLPFRRSIAEAGRLILDNAPVRTLVLAAMVCEVFGFSYQTTVPSVARDLLRAGAQGLGTLTAAGSLGATLAVLALTRLPGRARREPVLAGVFALYGLSLVAFANAASLLLAAGMMMVVGACAAAFDALQQTMLQLAVPEGQRGRAAGIWSFSIGTAPLGHLEVGALAATLGTPGALVINGSAVILAAAALLLRSPVYRPRRFTRSAIARSKVQGT